MRRLWLSVEYWHEPTAAIVVTVQAKRESCKHTTQKKQQPTTTTETETAEAAAAQTATATAKSQKTKKI